MSKHEKLPPPSPALTDDEKTQIRTDAQVEGTLPPKRKKDEISKSRELLKQDEPIEGMFWSHNDGKLIQNSNNAYLMMATRGYIAKCFAFDVVAGESVLLHPLPNMNTPRASFKPRLLKDSDYGAALRWLQQQPGFGKATRGDVIMAVEQMCEDAAYDPLRSYLEGLPTPDPDSNLLDEWMFSHMGVNSADPLHMLYVRTIGRKWLISAVARAMQPGCQADYALILEGTQGRKKSTALRILAGDEFFSDSLPDFHSKDAAQHIMGKWIVEMAELTTVIKAEVEDMRKFITRRAEKFRPPYGRKEIVYDRRCVFAGSTNRDDYLKDSSGERRLWPVRITRDIDTEALQRDRDAIWAEAYQAWLSGESWWLENPIVEDYARSAQMMRVPGDPWLETVRAFLADQTTTTLRQVYIAVAREPINVTPAEQRRMLNVLSACGFTKDGDKRDWTKGPDRGATIYARGTNAQGVE